MSEDYHLSDFLFLPFTLGFRGHNLEVMFQENLSQKSKFLKLFTLLSLTFSGLSGKRNTPFHEFEFLKSSFGNFKRLFDSLTIIFTMAAENC